jgi:hypothetical protein
VWNSTYDPSLLMDIRQLWNDVYIPHGLVAIWFPIFIKWKSGDVAPLRNLSPVATKNIGTCWPLSSLFSTNRTLARRCNRRVKRLSAKRAFLLRTEVAGSLVVILRNISSIDGLQIERS